MKVILQKDVKNVGKVGDLVTVKDGFARNFLFPRKLAQTATEKGAKAWDHLKKVAESKKKKAMTERAQVCAKLNGTIVSFKRQAGEGDKLFGSVTTSDIATALEAQGFMVERREVHLEEPIKMLGQYKVTVKFAEDLTAEVTVAVERE